MVLHSPTEVIAELIRSWDEGTNPLQEGPWPVFVNQMPNQPYSAIVIADDGAPNTGRIHRTGQTTGLPAYQLRVRATKMKEAKEKAYELGRRFDLVRRDEVTVEDVVYVVQAIHQENVLPTFIGPDPDNRMNYVINGSISYKRKE
jgi:ribosomal protein L20A (L18A)